MGYLNNDGLSHLWGKIKEKLNKKVDSEAGKGLSTNDYTTAEKNKLAGFSTAENYAMKSDIVNVYKYKGSVATYAELPTDNLTAGDVYDVQESGMNYAWTGTEWDNLGGVFEITAITNDEIDAIMAE